jgi:hypothetical protein
VAQYANACNVFGDPETLAHKFAVLKDHCEAVGRPFEDIERTTIMHLNLSGSREGWGGPQTPDQAVEQAAAYAEVGVQHIMLGVTGVHDPATLDLVCDKLLPQLRAIT